MSLASVRAFFAANAPDLAILEHDTSTATVLEAAATLGVAPGQIAKTLSIRVDDQPLLIVTRGDARLDNRKARDAFGGRPRMLSAEDAEALTGHPVGGVCPFGLATPVPVCCDVSLKAFEVVYPAAGSRTAAVRLAPMRLAALTDARWVDVCVLPTPEGA